MPDFVFPAFLDASLVWLADHTLVFLALSVTGVWVAAHLLLRALEQDLDRLEQQARIARSYDAARDELSSRRRKGRHETWASTSNFPTTRIPR